MIFISSITFLKTVFFPLIFTKYSQSFIINSTFNYIIKFILIKLISASVFNNTEILTFLIFTTAYKLTKEYNNFFSITFLLFIWILFEFKMQSIMFDLTDLNIILYIILIDVNRFFIIIFNTVIFSIFYKI